MRTAFELASPQKEAIEAALKAIFGEATGIEFETKPDLISGIELTANGQKFAWSIADYLTSLTSSVHGLLAAQIRSCSGLPKSPYLMPPDSLLTAVDRAFAGMKQAQRSVRTLILRARDGYDHDGLHRHCHSRRIARCRF